MYETLWRGQYVYRHRGADINSMVQTEEGMLSFEEANAIEGRSRSEQLGGRMCET